MIDKQKSIESIDWIVAPFAHLTDPAAMVELFQKQLPSNWINGRSIVGCTIPESRLKLYQKPTSWHKSTLSLSYELTLTSAGNVQPVTELLYVQAFLADRSHNAWGKILIENASLVEQNSICHLPNEKLIIWRFPADPAMHSLAEIVTADHLSLPGRENGNQLVERQSISNSVLKYRPEIRCTTRVDINTRHAAEAELCTQYKWSKPQRSRALIAKTFAENEGERLFTQMSYFHHEKSATITVPEPIKYMPHIKTLWLAAIDGQPLGATLNPDTSDAYLAQIARGLATIHQSDFIGLERITASDLFIEFKKKIVKLSRACPACIDLFSSQILKMATLAQALEQPQQRVIHGDFHLEQFLVQSDRIVFLDFDDLAWGDPEQDLAEFIVALYFYGYDEATVAEMALQLIQHYQFYSGRAINAMRPINAVRLYWHATVEYMNRAYRFYQEQRPGWRVNLHDCLINIDIVERLVSLDKVNL